MEASERTIIVIRFRLVTDSLSFVQLMRIGDARDDFDIMRFLGAVEESINSRESLKLLLSSFSFKDAVSNGVVAESIAASADVVAVTPELTIFVGIKIELQIRVYTQFMYVYFCRIILSLSV